MIVKSSSLRMHQDSVVKEQKRRVVFVCVVQWLFVDHRIMKQATMHLEDFFLTFFSHLDSRCKN
jgi:hypothetical protein